MTTIPIPTARGLLRAIADSLVEADRDEIADLAERILTIANGMYRRQPAMPRAPKTSEPVTPAMIRQVRALKAAWPRMSHQALAEKVGTNSGRVSEIFHGKWDHLLEDEE